MLPSNTLSMISQTGKVGGASRLSYLLYLLVAALTTIVFWPAIWSNDTISQFAEARSGAFTSHHPPLMAALLRPFALLGAEKVVIALQASVYWGMVWLLFGRAGNLRTRDAIKAAIPLLLPSSIALIGIMWKDVHLGLSWGMAWTLLWLSANRPQRSHAAAAATLILILILILYGLLIRHNAFVAVAPLILVLLNGRPWLKRPSTTLLAYAGIAVAALCLSQGVNRTLTVAEDVPTAEMSLPIFDLAGISLHSGRNAFPFAMSDGQLAQVGQCYRPIRWDSLYFNNSPCGWLMAAMLRYDADVGSVRLAWLTAIADEPVAYLRHRGAFVHNLLTYERGPGEITHRAVFRMTPGEIASPAQGLLILSYVGILDLWEAWGLLMPVAALGWAALLLWLTRGTHGHAMIAAAALVAVLNILSHFPFGVASDQRYAYPSFLLLALATSAALLGRQGGAHREGDMPASP